MTLSTEQRDALKRQVVACLRNEPETRQIVLFGFRIDRQLPTPERAREGSEWAPLAVHSGGAVPAPCRARCGHGLR
jgi:hypothetical protein